MSRNTVEETVVNTQLACTLYFIERSSDKLLLVAIDNNYLLNETSYSSCSKHFGFVFLTYVALKS